MTHPPASPLPPGSTIGVLGGGQLGRMLALAAARLGFDVVILDPEENSPAGRVAARQIVAPYDDRWALKRLAEVCDVVTYEFENVPADTVAELTAQGARVAPGAKALAAAQDRVVEKTFLAEIGVPTVAFAAVETAEDLAAAVAKIGAPSLLKTRREGYDGKARPGSSVRPRPPPPSTGSPANRPYSRPRPTSCASCR